MTTSSSSAGGNFFERHKIKIAGALLVGGCYALIRKRYTGLFRGSVFKTEPVLTGKTVVITEPHFAKKYSGYYAAKEFASRGAKVYVLVPKPIHTSEASADILKTETGNKDIHVCSVDLTSLRSIRRFANGLRMKSETVDILVNNADLYRPPSVPSEEGYPRRFVVNFLGRAILTQYLLESLNKSPNGKILNVNNICSLKESQSALDSRQLRGDMDYHMGHPEVFNYLIDLDVYSCQLYNANRKFVSEMAKKLKDTNTTISQVEVEMKQSQIMKVRLFSLLFEELVYFYRHNHASAGKLIAYAALSDEYDKQSGVTINGTPPAEKITFDDSGMFFRHTSQVLETFEELHPLRPALEAEKYKTTA